MYFPAFSGARISTPISATSPAARDSTSNDRFPPDPLIETKVPPTKLILVPVGQADEPELVIDQTFLNSEPDARSEPSGSVTCGTGISDGTKGLRRDVRRRGKSRRGASW